MTLNVMITFVIMHPSLNNDRKKLVRSGEYQLAAFQGHLCEFDANYNSTYLSFSDVQQYYNFIYSFRQKFYLFNNVKAIRVSGWGFIGIDSVFYDKGALAYRSSTVGGYMSL
jgi:hypothetical protein